VWLTPRNPSEGSKGVMGMANGGQRAAKAIGKRREQFIYALPCCELNQLAKCKSVPKIAAWQRVRGTK